MASEIRSRERGGVRAETIVSRGLKKRFAKACKVKAKTSVAQVLRDFMQSYSKGVRV